MEGFRVFRSTDGGLTWTAAGTRLTFLPIASLTASGRTVLAGTCHAGVFGSRNHS
jgi:hypothetical protein